MKKKLLALVCALALTFSFAGCTISTPDTVGSIGDFEITSGMYLLAQYGAYQQDTVPDGDISLPEKVLPSPYPVCVLKVSG